MSITRSYNRHNNTYYAYETEYVFDEEKQKKVAKRHCIGKFDSNGNVIPNGRRGRCSSTPFPPRVQKEEAGDASPYRSERGSSPKTDTGNARQQTVNNSVRTAISLVNELEADVRSIKRLMGKFQSSLLEIEGKIHNTSIVLNDLTDNNIFFADIDSNISK